MIYGDRSEVINFKEKLRSVKTTIDIFFIDWNKEKVGKLKNQQVLEKDDRVIKSVQWGNRFVAATGSLLSLFEYSRVGGSITLFCSLLIEPLVTQFKEKNSEDKKEWEKFCQDSKKLWEIYYECSKNIVIEPIERMLHNDEQGLSALNSLKDAAANFITETKTEYGMSMHIEISAGKAQEEFPNHLVNNWESDKKQIDFINEAISDFLKESEAEREINQVEISVQTTI